MRHHGLQLVPLLVELQLELSDDLDLNARLRRALVVQGVGGIEVPLEGRNIRAGGVAPGPAAVPMAVEESKPFWLPFLHYSQA